MVKTYNELMTEARETIPELTPEDVHDRQGNGDGPFCSMSGKRMKSGRVISRGLFHPARILEIQVEGALSDKDRPVIAYCAGGVRSLLAAQTLKEMGYAEVYSMAEGFNGWKDRSFPFAKDFELTTNQLERYSRHFTLAEVGEKARGSCYRPRSCSSARAVWDLRRPFTSRPQGSGPSASWISTSWTAAIFSGKSSTGTRTSGCRRPNPPSIR